MEKIKIICLTPVKNEDWILERFLKATSMWADLIIIADQGSTDKTKQIAGSFSKVILIENKSTEYNESERQKMLIDEARKIKGQKILVALDADEFLSANSINNKEWNTIKELEPGTVIKFDWINVLPNRNIYWKGPYKMPFAFIDDNSNHEGKAIHSPRIPIKSNSPEYFAKDIKILHLQYADWDRMRSKHRWYQSWEHIKNPKRSIISIFRQYNHMYSIKKNNFMEIKDEWFKLYDISEIDIKNFKKQDYYYWDIEMLNFFEKYGLNFFSKIDIWDKDWYEISKNIKSENLIGFSKNPQTFFDRLLIKYLKKTQPYMNNIFFKIFDRMTRLFF